MKYCKKCGMLLEDNMEICIGCGSDVTKKGTYTKYPEPMQEKIELEKKEANRIYLVFKLFKDNNCEKEYQQYSWSAVELVGNYNNIGRSFPIKLVKLLKKARTK